MRFAVSGINKQSGGSGNITECKSQGPKLICARFGDLGGTGRRDRRNRGGDSLVGRSPSRKHISKTLGRNDRGLALYLDYLFSVSDHVRKK